MGSLSRDFDDFFDHAMCGFLTLDTTGVIIEANQRMGNWLGCVVADLPGKKFSDLLPIGGKVYYETHLTPLLRLQGFFDEVALELVNKDKQRIPVLVNAYERRDDSGNVLFIRVAVFKASDRRVYEQNLFKEKNQAENNLLDEKNSSALREQFIAVLGHDLRNPLSSVLTGASVLAMMLKDEQEKKIAVTIQNSGKRMADMINDIMDFARGRLGGGMLVNLQPTVTKPMLLHVIEELQSSFPDRIINSSFDITEPVTCDMPRLSQLLSNLLANALIHGAADKPVYVKGFHKDGYFELSVSNSGKPIPATAMEQLFHPFSREASLPSQNGLGLGLYIASQIAIAHGGELVAISTDEETRFTFRMNKTPR